MHLAEGIDKSNLPRHIAIIMDGNGRWAKLQDMPRVMGHIHGVEAVRQASEACAELGVGYLTLYAFSTENWNRPEAEINALMGLLVDTIHKELKTLHDNNIRLNAIGDLSKLPLPTRNALEAAIENTQSHTGLVLTLALNYSGRWDIINAVEKAMESNIDFDPAQRITEEAFGQLLATGDIPDPDLLIRTSGENRISNFLLWQLAYAELLFLPVLWPDFKKSHLFDAIREYQNRERRFGLTGDQVNS
jgi:undecaprenyl diphosphate synthase